MKWSRDSCFAYLYYWRVRSAQERVRISSQALPLFSECEDILRLSVNKVKTIETTEEHLSRRAGRYHIGWVTGGDTPFSGQIHSAFRCMDERASGWSASLRAPWVRLEVRAPPTDHHTHKKSLVTLSMETVYTTHLKCAIYK